MSRRQQIQMSEQEISDFLAQERTVVCATNGRDGWPHLMPLWFVVRPSGLWAWTYARSQKVRNLERDFRATLQVEAGEEYHLLRGVMVKADVVVHRDVETVRSTGLAIFARYSDGGEAGELDPQVRAMVEGQAPKRVALEFVERQRASWDHRKLGATY